MSRYKPVGWMYESYRHSLAARGIPTGRFAAHRFRFEAKPQDKAVAKVDAKALKSNIDKQVKVLRKYYVEHPEELNAAIAAGIVKNAYSVDAEGNQVMALEFDRNAIYKDLGYTPEQINAVISLYEQAQVPEDPDKWRIVTPSGDIYKGRRSKGGQVIPLTTVSEERFISEFSSLPLETQRRYLEKYSGSYKYLENIRNSLGLKEEDITDPVRFAMINKNDQARILRLMRRLEDEMSREPDKYVAERKVLLSKAEERGDVTESAGLPVTTGDISRKFLARDDAQAVVKRYEEQVEAGYKLTPREEREYRDAVGFLVKPEERGRIVDLLDVADKMIRPYVEQAKASGVEPEVLAKILSDYEQSIKPYKDQLKEMSRAADLEAAQRLSRARQYSEEGRVKDVQRLASEIDALSKVDDNMLEVRAQQIKKEIYDNEKRLGSFVDPSGAQKSVSLELRKNLDSVYSKRKIERSMTRNLEREAQKKDRVARMIEGKRLKREQRGLPPVAPKRASKAKLTDREKAIEKIKKALRMRGIKID